MNVNIKPLKWVCETDVDGGGFRYDLWVAVTPLGVIDVFPEAGDNQKWTYHSRTLVGCNTYPNFPTADAAKLAAERWYTLTVLDCLQPEAGLDGMEYLMLHDWCLGLHDEVKQ